MAHYPHVLALQCEKDLRGNAEKKASREVERSMCVVCLLLLSQATFFCIKLINLKNEIKKVEALLSKRIVLSVTPYSMCAILSVYSIVVNVQNLTATASAHPNSCRPH
jgi:hypothetical protein